ncbi:MAG: hypothetical protein M0Z99_00370 [Betaproteobacteria bacterium]|nr:hypothetical protein [Betaproteobacteria bacterium]
MTTTVAIGCQLFDNVRILKIQKLLFFSVNDYRLLRVNGPRFDEAQKTCCDRFALLTEVDLDYPYRVA